MGPLLLGPKFGSSLDPLDVEDEGELRDDIEEGPSDLRVLHGSMVLEGRQCWGQVDEAAEQAMGKTKYMLLGLMGIQ